MLRFRKHTQETSKGGARMVSQTFWRKYNLQLDLFKPICLYFQFPFFSCITSSTLLSAMSGCVKRYFRTPVLIIKAVTGNEIAIGTLYFAVKADTIQVIKFLISPVISSLTHPLGSYFSATQIISGVIQNYALPFSSVIGTSLYA